MQAKMTRPAAGSFRYGRQGASHRGLLYPQQKAAYHQTDLFDPPVDPAYNLTISGT